MAAVLGVYLAAASAASAAQLVARNASAVGLSVNRKGEALVSFRSNGTFRRILLWGAINARVPTARGRQVRFKVDYSGGWARFHTRYWKHFGGGCARYDGPVLPQLVTACKAADGSYWAAQSWPQPLPNFGFSPWRQSQRWTWLEISHWRGPVAKLEAGTSWVNHGRAQAIFGRATYAGQPVHGFHTTRRGAPTDGFGRLVYLDTFNSVYGRGWRRENAFVPHKPTGVFCYWLTKTHPGRSWSPPGVSGARGPATGQKYRLLLAGPGVTPNVGLIVPGLHRFDPRNPADATWQRQQTGRLLAWHDRLCSVGL